MVCGSRTFCLENQRISREGMFHAYLEQEVWSRLRLGLGLAWTWRGRSDQGVVVGLRVMEDSYVVVVMARLRVKATVTVADTPVLAINCNRPSVLQTPNTQREGVCTPGQFFQ